MAGKQVLHLSRSVTLNAAGTGTVTFGPDLQPGPPRWHVDAVIVQTNRPGLAPVPKGQGYRNEAIASNSLGLTYDASFSQGGCSEDFSGHERFIFVWTGGQLGDVATCTLTGTMG